MQKTVSVARKAILYISALVLVAGHPLTAMATSEEPVTSPETTIVTEQVETLPPEPQEKELNYTYDSATNKWNSEAWQYNPESNSYEKPPEPVIVEPEVSNLTAPGSGTPEEGMHEESDQSTEKTVNTNVDLNNKIISDALSGDALVSNNTTAGSALTGDATAVANIINSVNSSVSAGENQKIATFTKDIYGDVEGDIILYPLLLKAMLEQQAKNSGMTDINTTTNFNINNDVTLNAQSGDATVEGNTTAGDATTGNATAMANVINILNSMIATQDSFIGTINIYGSLNGDILIAPDFIPQMLANNGGGEGGSTQLSTQDTTTIVNNISAVAESGAASVFGNTNGGNATSGDADSNVVIFNVTGRRIVAENSMLIFVNVLGKWVGLILDAPAGTNAAMFGSGVTTNEQYAPDLTLQSESKHGITNTIAVNATTGDATVAHNTTGGNATSGNAGAFANVANISNSSLNLSGWFRMLFINITGDWEGSLKVGPPYGLDPEEVIPTLQPTGPAQFVPHENKPVQSARASVAPVIIDSRYLANTAFAADVAMESQTETTVSDTMPEAQVLGDTDTKTDTTDEDNNSYWFYIITGSIFLVGGSIIGIRRFLF